MRPVSHDGGGSAAHSITQSFTRTRQAMLAGAGSAVASRASTNFPADLGFFLAAADRCCFANWWRALYRLCTLKFRSRQYWASGIPRACARSTCFSQACFDFVRFLDLVLIVLSVSGSIAVAAASIDHFRRGSTGLPARLQEILIDGFLVREGIVDRKKLLASLPGTAARSPLPIGCFLDCVAAEAWSRAWSGGRFAAVEAA